MWPQLRLLVVLVLLHYVHTERPQSDLPIAVVGGGFSGMTAALELKKLGYDVVLYEKSSVLGGRAHLIQSPGGEFTFDAGPSWYWMPDVFDRVFERYGAVRADLYNLTRLDPAYRVFLADPTGESDRSTDVNVVDVPGTYEGLLQWLDDRDPDNNLREFFAEADEKYVKGVHDWIWRPMKSFVEMLDPQLALAALRMNMFGSYESHLGEYTSDEVVRTILKWPVIFVGASPSESPAMYSMLSYSGHAHGTFYPDQHGLSAPVFALEKVMREHGIEIRLSTEINRIAFDCPRTSSHAMTARAVCYQEDGVEVCDRVQGVVAAGDYHHMEQVLLPPHVRRYDSHYWERQVLSPSCMLYYLGLDTKLPGVTHHTFFFDSDLESHLSDVFVHHANTSDPTFYVATTSKTDRSVAPEEGEAVFVLVPMSHRLNGTDDEGFREELFNLVFDRMEALLPDLQDGSALRDHIVYRKDYGPRDFEREFYALRGNAFGLANILTQSLVFKPAISSLADNVVFAGHLTHPGPGVPPSLVSGIVAAGVLDDKLEANETWNHPTYVQVRAVLYWTGLSILALVVSGHFMLYLLSLWFPMIRSYLLCIKLYYLHGRTYFAAGTLMRPRRFLDTAAMYALFRVADDCVDEPGRSDEEKTRELSAFQEAFWICLRKGKGDETMHPTLPAIIDAALRREYPDDLFIRFFGAMQKDTGPNIVQTWEELLSYMDGSAAVIGDFMVPILMDGDSLERQLQAMPHARDLGMAFQLTNMIRDIDEDLDLDRQYMPQELCKQYGVDLKQRDHSTPGFRELIQEMLRRTDQFYESADHGIEMLPSDVSPVIKVASTMYHKIHDKFEEADYRIFDGRVRVSFAQKLAIATSSISLDKISRIVGVELYMVLFLTIWQYLAPLLSFAWAFGIMAMLVDGVPGCTYAHFHLLFTVPVMYFLLQNGRSRSSPGYFGSAFLWICVLCVVASVYTTPWDNLLVYLDVWGYSDHRILATIGWVPIEEYAFFTIETLMVGGFWMACFPTFDALKNPPTSSRRRTKSIVIAVLVGLILAAFCAWGFYLIFMVPSGLYLGLILSWSSPVLLLQWIVGSQALLRHKRQLAICLTMAACYLSAIDRWAISQGIWLINSQKTVPMVMDTILPFEEALFFLVTSMMCVWGLTLAMLVTKRQKYGKVSFLQALWDVMKW